MISRDLPGIVSLWVLGTTNVLPCRVAPQAWGPAGSSGRGSNGWLDQHGHTAPGKGSLGMGNSLEKKKEATLCLRGEEITKRNFFLHAAAWGRLFCRRGSRRSLRSTWAGSLVLRRHFLLALLFVHSHTSQVSGCCFELQEIRNLPHLSQVRLTP